MTVVAGIDGYKKGWVGVVLTDGLVTAVQIFDSIAAIRQDLLDAAAIGIDIPIGMPTGPRRAADAEARRFIKPRTSSVFNTPPRAVIEAPTYEEANRIARERFDMGVSSQAYRGLRSKLLEVDAAVKPGSRIFEVHPEVSFRGLAGRPLPFYKKSWNGQQDRRQLLQSVGIVLPDRLDEAGDVPVDDVLDAAVGAWSAMRYAAGEAVSIPDPPERTIADVRWPSGGS